MVGFLGIEVVAARRLDPGDHLAEARKRQGKRTVEQEGIVLRRAPARRNFILNLNWQFFEEVPVLTRPSVAAFVGPSIR
jgi:hypothetical protein